MIAARIADPIATTRAMMIAAARVHPRANLNRYAMSSIAMIAITRVLIGGTTARTSSATVARSITRRAAMRIGIGVTETACRRPIAAAVT